MLKNPLVILIYSFCVSFLPLNADDLSLTLFEDNLVKERALWLRNHTLLFLDNKQIVWLLTPPFERQTWTEWLNSVHHIQPDPRFFFQIQSWKSASLFRLYTYKWEKEEDTPKHPLEEFFERKPNLYDFPYFIENVETREMTLCQILSIDQLGAFVQRYGEECYRQGYNDGYSANNCCSR